MKYRVGPVTNSSSTSFIAALKKQPENMPALDGYANGFEQIIIQDDLAERFSEEEIEVINGWLNKGYEFIFEGIAGQGGEDEVVTLFWWLGGEARLRDF